MMMIMIRHTSVEPEKIAEHAINDHDTLTEREKMRHDARWLLSRYCAALLDTAG